MGNRDDRNDCCGEIEIPQHVITTCQETEEPGKIPLKHLDVQRIERLFGELTTCQTNWVQEGCSKKEIVQRTSGHPMWQQILTGVFKAIKEGDAMKEVLRIIKNIFQSMPARAGNAQSNTEDYVLFVEMLAAEYERLSAGNPPEDISKEVWARIGDTIRMVPLGAILDSNALPFTEEQSEITDTRPSSAGEAQPEPATETEMELTDTEGSAVGVAEIVEEE